MREHPTNGKWKPAAFFREFSDLFGCFLPPILVIMDSLSTVADAGGSSARAGANKRNWRNRREPKITELVKFGRDRVSDAIRFQCAQFASWPL
jgi:hypothetical protein